MQRECTTTELVDEIDRLREENNRMRSILQRLADDQCSTTCVCCGLTRGNALAALPGPPEGSGDE